VSDIVTDAYAYAKARTLPVAKGPITAGKPPDKQKTVLTMEDLTAALNEYGIPASRCVEVDLKALPDICRQSAILSLVGCIVLGSCWISIGDSTLALFRER
jgi:hypothetical protein